MQHVGEGRHVLHELKHKRAEVQQSAPMSEDGWPSDRTLCPYCLAGEDDCKTCHGSGMVCPTCRGARALSDARAERPRLVGCPDCTDWLDYQTHRWENGWPVFDRSYWREAANIEYHLRKSQGVGQ